MELAPKPLSRALILQVMMLLHIALVNFEDTFRTFKDEEMRFRFFRSRLLHENHNKLLDLLLRITPNIESPSPMPQRVECTAMLCQLPVIRRQSINRIISYESVLGSIISVMSETGDPRRQVWSEDKLFALYETKEIYRLFASLTDQLIRLTARY